MGEGGKHAGESKKASRPKRSGPSVQKNLEAAKGNPSRRHGGFQMAAILPESQSRCHSGAA